MPVSGISIEKEVTWRGNPERFSNVYHYWHSSISWATITDAEWLSFVTQIVNAEKAIHSTLVTFKIARIFGPTDGSEAANVMQYITDLTGNGSLPSTSKIFGELALVVQWPMERSSLGRKRFLRKYLRTFSYGTGTAPEVNSGGPLSSTPLPGLAATYAAAVDDLSWAYGGTLCAANGDGPNDAAYALPYLHTRQFRR
jgi:hypothetical protein